METCLNGQIYQLSEYRMLLQPVFRVAEWEVILVDLVISTPGKRYC